MIDWWWLLIAALAGGIGGFVLGFLHGMSMDDAPVDMVPEEQADARLRKIMREIER